VKEAGNVYMALALKDPLGSSFPQASDQILANLLNPLKESARGVGHINSRIDFDGKTRAVPLYISHEGALIPQLSFKAACDYLGIECGAPVFRGNNITVGKNLILPVSSNGAFFVNYPGKWTRSFNHYSFVDIVRAYLTEEQGQRPDLDLSALKNKVCIIGLTATATTDIRPNPLEKLYPMVGLQASVFNSVITGQFIRPAGRVFNTAFAFLIFLVAMFICLKSSPLKGLTLIISLAAGCFIVSETLFVLSNLWINIFLPEFIIAVTYIGSTSYRFLSELKKRQLLEKELDIARQIQQSFLPKDVKGFSGVSVSSFMQPAKFVAGDLYDILAMQDNKVGVFIGDVSGKGIPASLIMAQTISLFRVFANQFAKPSEVLNRLNKELYGRFEGRFVTCLYMVIDPKEDSVEISSAGHSPVLVYRKNGNSVAETAFDAGLPLGVMEEAEYQDSVFDLARNDKAMVFTDGVTEARDVRSGEFGLEAVKKIILEHGRASSDRILKATKEELFRFSSGAAQHDDITIVVIENRKD
jgi:serine phosphatase RsbU (regulator of sigma subunit)